MYRWCRCLSRLVCLFCLAPWKKKHQKNLDCVSWVVTRLLPPRVPVGAPEAMLHKEREGCNIRERQPIGRHSAASLSAVGGANSGEALVTLRGPVERGVEKGAEAESLFSSRKTASTSQLQTGAFFSTTPEWTATAFDIPATLTRLERHPSWFSSGHSLESSTKMATSGAKFGWCTGETARGRLHPR